MAADAPGRYPFKKVAAAERPSKAVLQSLGRPALADGPGKPRRKPPETFLKTEVDEARADRLVDDAQLSRWLHAHAERGSSTRAVAEQMIQRARRHPNQRNFERIGAVLQEIGRRRGGGKRLRELITQELVDEFIEKGD